MKKSNTDYYKKHIYYNKLGNQVRKHLKWKRSEMILVITKAYSDIYLAKKFRRTLKAIHSMRSRLMNESFIHKKFRLKTVVSQSKKLNGKHKRNTRRIRKSK